jgi:acyl-coenzyme A thioesterase PaaI-like protein
LSDAVSHPLWALPPVDDPELGEAVETAVGVFRELQEALATAGATDPAVWSTVGALLGDARDLLAAYAVQEEERVVGRWPEVPGRSQALVPPVFIDQRDLDSVRGRVTFGNFYLGRNDAVHGGTLPLVFDEVLGFLANEGRSPARTAYLHVDYRAITPVGVELVLTGRIEREEGRKRFVRGELWHGDTLTAELTGLFIALRPGQA